MKSIIIAGQSNSAFLADPFETEWKRRTGEEIEVVDMGGLFPCIRPGIGNELAERLPGRDTLGVWWIQGETEAQTGTTEAAYFDCLRQIQRLIFVPLMVSPIAGWHESYKWLRPVLAAQYRWPHRGPEYYDLPVAEDNTHLTEKGRVMFAARGVEYWLAWEQEVDEIKAALSEAAA